MNASNEHWATGKSARTSPIKATLAVLVAAVLCVACGGDDDAPAAPPPAGGGGTTPPPPPPAATTTTIKRDAYGVPHIFANDVYGLFYGAGYAQAEDRLFQMEMTRRSAAGTTAEVLGPDFVAYDKATRSNFDPASLHRPSTRR